MMRRITTSDNNELDLRVHVIALAVVLHFEIEALMRIIPPPLVPDIRFDPTQLDVLQPENLFRFSVDQLQTLIVALRIPGIMRTSQRDRFYTHSACVCTYWMDVFVCRFTAMEGLCIVLRRLVFPVRWMDVVVLFGRQTGPLCRIHA